MVGPYLVVTTGGRVLKKFTHRQDAERFADSKPYPLMVLNYERFCLDFLETPPKEKPPDTVKRRAA